MATRPGRNLLLGLCAVLAAAWLCSTISTAFLVSKVGLAPAGMVAAPQASWGQTAQQAEASISTARQSKPTKPKLSDEWVETCKEWCDLACKGSKRLACKSHCGARDMTQPLYNQC
mmetsp:Transcript_153808/g.472893  ORF Transcript_153808/g.472893 Transcript_153808/m.472893 type:complete len:116 (+) Transcript_153808:96-443(+)